MTAPSHRIPSPRVSASPAPAQPRTNERGSPRGAREAVAAKARRYLCEGRLVIAYVSGDHVSAHCRGDGAMYRVGHNPASGWYCTCPAKTDRCCHLEALRLVVVRRPA